MGSYIIKKSESGKYHFNLHAKNKEIILTSQMYKARNGALKGVRSVMANAPVAPIEDLTLEKPAEQKNPKFQIYLGKDEKYYFRLIAANGQPIGRSEGYNGKPACKSGIQSVVKNADSEIVKATEKE